MTDFVKALEFFRDVLPGERIYLLVRHGERRHITAADKDYGAHVGLTEAGRAQATALGRLFPVDGDAVYFSSPVGRCMDTAKCIAEGRVQAGYRAAVVPSGAACADAARVSGEACAGSPVSGASRVSGCADVPVSDAARVSGCAAVTPLDVLGHFYVKDYPAYLGVLNDKFYQNICGWIDSGSHPAFYPLHERAEELLQFMLEKGGARFNIFSTHDAWVVPTLVHFCGMHFTPQRWMNYLTGIAFVTGESGRDLRRIVPVTGMESGWLEF